MGHRGRWLLAVGALLVLVGVTLGALIPVSYDGIGPVQSCGTPWFGSIEENPELNAATNQANDFFCGEDARQPRGTLALVIVGLGVAVAGSAFVVDRRRAKSPSGS